MGQGRCNCSVGLDRCLGPSATPKVPHFVTGRYYYFWVNLWDFSINLSISLTGAWSISAGCKYDFPHVPLCNVIDLSHWHWEWEALSIAALRWLHEHDGSLVSPIIMLRWLFSCACPARTLCTLVCFWYFATVNSRFSTYLLRAW